MNVDTKTRVRKALLYSVGQLALVVAGIVIALQFDNWNEYRKQLVQRDLMLRKIRTELVANCDQIQAAGVKRLAFQAELEAKSEAWSDQDRRKLYLDLPEDQRFPSWPGLQPMQLEVALFETAKATGLLAELQPGLLARLSRTYADLNTINALGRELLNQLFRINYDSRTGDALQVYWRIQEEFFGAQLLMVPKMKAIVAVIDEQTR